MKTPTLNPRLLIPSLLRYEVRLGNSGMNQAIRYLRYVIEKLGSTDPVIHNYLLALFVQNARNDGEADILEFLSVVVRIISRQRLI